ncbi:YccF domain-containing protein [Arachidicoccus sp.]|uniref:YccF domain-containing protein n=1 Tax=Arachidicoccus sp. TaxID=1872624 RepID=UPI003D1E1C5B
MNILGNIIWIIFGGFIIFLEYMVGGFILCLTIVGIPFGLQCFKIGIASLAPFGMTISDKKPGITDGCIPTVLNIFWIFCGGIWIAFTHLIFGLLFCITIIGIPFGKQHFKLMSLCFAPFGKKLS